MRWHTLSTYIGYMRPATRGIVANNSAQSHPRLRATTFTPCNPGRCISTSQSVSASKNIQDGPSLADFISQSTESQIKDDEDTDSHYLPKSSYSGRGLRVYIETYGCQMNVNDTEIARAILLENGFREVSKAWESDIVLIMTCSIREGAEDKIWTRINYYKTLNKKRKHVTHQLKVGILGCMAERLKTKLLGSVDLVCGPDAYRDLPRLLTITEDGGSDAVNVQLSLEETYAEVVPVRRNKDAKSAFVSIMRGCDNMCSYCIVPFTRGRERSRDIKSIVNEVKILSDQGVKEVTLLGQNVNSYRDLSQKSFSSPQPEPTILSSGFKTVYKPKVGGLRFADLLSAVADVDPEMRIRFTSPHPKDFPDEVLHLIKERANICNQLHLPAQSGSTKMLSAMRRGYTREAYIELVHHIRDILPDVVFSSDFIAGFCGEIEADHLDTLSLMELVRYNFAYCFPYSMRGKTHAYHKLDDNVPQDVKIRRHDELIAKFREHAEVMNQAKIGEVQLVLVEGTSKRSDDDLAGRNDGNTKVIFPNDVVLDSHREEREIKSGDYVAVRIVGGSSQVLRGVVLYHTTLQKFSPQTEGMSQQQSI